MKPLALALLLIAGTAHADALDDWQRRDNRQRIEQREHRLQYERRAEQGRRQYERMLEDQERDQRRMYRLRRENSIDRDY